MFRVIRLLIAAAIGAGLGLGSVWLVLTDPRFERGNRIGPWEVQSGAAPNDPYANARAARDGRFSLGAAEGVAFVATMDSAGRRLRPDCHYAVAGPIPQGSLWTLSVTDLQGRPPDNPADRIGFTSLDVVRQADGTIEVTVGRSVRPGNFVPIGSLASLMLTLRVYSSRLSADLPASDGLPAVTRMGCAVMEAADVQ